MWLQDVTSGRQTHLESRCGIADSWGPYLYQSQDRNDDILFRTYLAALSYSSNSGIASNFMFFGTANTSGLLSVSNTEIRKELTALWHLYKEHFLAFLWFGDMSRDEGILDRLSY
jgi:hypothetical protein